MAEGRGAQMADGRLEAVYRLRTTDHKLPTANCQPLPTANYQLRERQRPAVTTGPRRLPPNSRRPKPPSDRQRLRLPTPQERARHPIPRLVVRNSGGDILGRHDLLAVDARQQTPTRLQLARAASETGVAAA